MAVFQLINRFLIQPIGHRESEVSKRVDIFATALYHGMTVKALCDVDLSYTPPLSSPWGPVKMAATHWLNHNSNAMTVENN